MLPIILVAAFLFALLFLFSTSKKEKNKVALKQPFLGNFQSYLTEEVQFYKELS